MGQPITVSARPGIRPDVVHFELNRSLTGMGIERYADVDEATGVRPPDELARRLFALGVGGVTVYSSVVTVAAPAAQWPELTPKVIETIEKLFLRYGEGEGAPPSTQETQAQGEAQPG